MFDNTCKFLVENFSDDFTNWLLGKRVKLTALESTEPEAMLRQVARQIEQIEDQTQQRNLASSTAILAGLVLEQEIIERVLRSDMMRESSMYQAILAEGEAKGKAEGKAEGRAEGEAKARAEAEARMRQVAQNMLRSGISIEMTAQLIGLTVAEVAALQEQPS